MADLMAGLRARRAGERTYAAPMRILLTNDDGMHAPGIAAMHAALIGPAPLGEVYAVAPLTVQSATSHGVTFHQPLMTRQASLNGHDAIAVDGRPADCTKLALTNLWPEKFGSGSRPDLVVSGMNSGANCGINVLYSGTVAAALEAAFLGVPSIAVSLHIDRETPDFDRGAAAARRVIDRLLAGGLPRAHEALSINIPATEFLVDDPVVVVCPMNTHALVDRYERRVSPSGDVYYWASGHGLDFRGTDPGTDVHELFERRVTITPLVYDLTDRDRLSFWRERVAE